MPTIFTSVMMNHILPKVYQGNLQSCDLWSDYDITDVVTMCPEQVYLPVHIRQLDMPISDWGPISSKQLEEIFDFIDDSIKNNGNVLIHCFAGVNRSVAVTAAYIMYKTDSMWNNALDHVKKIHPEADPSDSLRDSVLKYFAKLDRYSVTTS